MWAGAQDSSIWTTTAGWIPSSPTGTSIRKWIRFRMQPISANLCCCFATIETEPLRRLEQRQGSTASLCNRGGARPLERSEKHTSELQSPDHILCRLLPVKKKKKTTTNYTQC